MFYRLFNWRTFFIVVALAIVGATFLYTRYIGHKILKEERQRVEEWIQANQTMQSSQDATAISLANVVMVNNEDMPLIATDQTGKIIDFRNIDSAEVAADTGYLTRKMKALAAENAPIDWVISDSPKLVYKVYFGNTTLLKEVQYYPFVQLVFVSLFIFLLIALINTQNKSTQNQVWAGLAKETAHQMGTPITSLQGWVAMLQEVQPGSDVVAELEKDVSRLKLVSDRFSKIGSAPKLESTDLVKLVAEMVAYMKRRAPGKVQIELHTEATDLEAKLSPTLFNWVLENLLKNALDAMDGVGRIDVFLERHNAEIIVDVKDTGKGISSSNLQKVFAPGFTTKKRGWGLGLTLSKRIMEQYHKGQLFVKNSEPGKGTTFRIILQQQATLKAS